MALNTAFDFQTPITANTTLYAKWIIYSSASNFVFENATGTITGYKGPEKNVNIPPTIHGVAVTTFGRQAFYNKGLTSVTIPPSVTSTGELTFAKNQLTSIIIPPSVTSIGASAFANNQLTSVTIPSSVTSIGDNAFSHNQLPSVTIPLSVTSIGFGAFSQNQLTSVTIPSSVASVGVWAFQNNQLTSVRVEATTPPTLGKFAFDGNSNLKDIKVPAGSSVVDAYKNADGWKDYADKISSY